MKENEVEIDNLMEHLKADGAFDCEHSCESVKQYFKGQIDSITSITKNIHNLLELILETQSKFIEIVKYAESVNDAKNQQCDHNTEH